MSVLGRGLYQIRNCDFVDADALIPVLRDLDARNTRLEAALLAYLTEGRDANFAAREAALKILNESGEA